VLGQQLPGAVFTRATTLLHPGDLFPELTVALPGGRPLQPPGALADRFGVVLFYRGSWCPYCNVAPPACAAV
jgi:thiol-disulfide isomerase/thioredoxin